MNRLNLIKLRQQTEMVRAAQNLKHEVMGVKHPKEMGEARVWVRDMIQSVMRKLNPPSEK